MGNASYEKQQQSAKTFICFNCHRKREHRTDYAHFINVPAAIYLYFCKGNAYSQRHLNCKRQWIAKGQPHLQPNLTNEEREA